MRLLAWHAVVSLFGCVASETCDLGIVGAGPGGAYAAWRAAVGGRSVCVFELAGRPGGRVHSLRGQGPAGDLVVEAGAYRYAPKTAFAKFSNFTWKISTPLTAAIVKELGLHSKVYNPNASQWDHALNKLVDANGNDVGYLTFVEAMLSLAEKHGAKVRYNATVVRLTGENSQGPVGVRLANGEEILVKALLLNLPQRPAVELLRNSDRAIASIFPRPLYVPSAENIMKLYVHYEDAWWPNELGLVAGAFFNTEPAPTSHNSPDHAPNQMPTPLQGQYHDGDVRCDGEGGRCRGYLQAFYGADSARQKGQINGALTFYSVFHDSISDDSVAHVTPALAHHRALLSEIHDSLIQLHRPALDAMNATARVSKLQPTSAVLSIWSQGVTGFHAGCHSPKGGTNPSPEDLPTAALQPLPGWPIYVANEAFGHMSCFAEGSLEMAEAAVKRMNISTPSWLDEARASLPEETMLDAMQVPTDPFLMPEGIHLRHMDSDSGVANRASLPTPITI